MHGVTKLSSTMTKLRVVFDASAATSTGKSLNDILLPGPCGYPLISDILLQFRLHKFAITGDISKMFREVSLSPADRVLHRFLWRPQPGGPLREGRMTRVTFGFASSPFLATQALRQTAIDHHLDHPEAAEVVLSKFYVDDCLTGANTEEAAIQLRSELNQLLSKGQFRLRKWRSNSSKVLESILEELKETEVIQSLPGENHKALGIHWDTNQDTFHIATPDLSQQDRPCTKRSVSSDVAKVYDISGVFAPVTLYAKVLLQRIWRAGLDWDDELPPQLAFEWTRWKDELSLLTDFAINRCYQHKEKDILAMELHGFADASMSAYACVIYLRVLYTDASMSVSLVYSKTKVAPLKVISIQKLELCGVVLLVKTLEYVSAILKFLIHKTFAWTDSTAVLGWLHTTPHRLHTFVTNRVSRAIESLPPDRWRHVPTDDNDVASRGATPSQLIKHTLWWSGPTWLHKPPHLWPERKIQLPDKDMPEFKTKTIFIVQQGVDYLERFSSYNRLLRVTAWIKRFYCNSRTKSKSQKNFDKCLSANELNEAETSLMLSHQNHFFLDN